MVGLQEGEGSLAQRWDSARPLTVQLLTASGGPQGNTFMKDQPSGNTQRASRHHSATYPLHRLGGGDSDRDRDREDEDDDEDSLAPSELELKERLARLRPALQLPAEGLGESCGLR